MKDDDIKEKKLLDYIKLELVEEIVLEYSKLEN